MASYDPFSLAAQTELSSPRYAQRKSWDRFFAKKSKEATQFAADEADRIAAELKKRPKGHLPSWLKMGLSILNPVAGVALEGFDILKRQKAYGKQIKEMGKDVIIPAKYKNTFMENYIRGSVMDNQQQGLQFLQGAKKADLITGLISAGLQAIPAMKQMGQTTKAAGTASMYGAPRDISVATGAKGAGIVPGTTSAANPFSVSGQVSRVAPATTVMNPVPLAPTYTFPSIGSAAPMSVAGTAPSLTSTFTNLSKASPAPQIGLLDKLYAAANKVGDKFSKLSIPGSQYLGRGYDLTVGNLTNPILQGYNNQYLNRLLTPGTYGSIGQDWLMNYLTKQQGEPYVTELSPPRYKI